MVTTQDGKLNVILPSPGTTKEFMSVAWACRVTSTREEANMHIADLDEKHVLKISGRCQIPCAKNFKPIKAGDELVLFRERAPQAVEVLPDAKRRKVGKHTA